MSCSRDRISSLPDEILGKILCLLPTKLVASTSVLSKRWRNLLGLVDTLCFDESMVVYPNEEEATDGSHRFSDFVDKTLSLLSDSPIKKVSLRRVHRCCTETYSRRVNRWIWTAMEHALSELHLYAPTPWSEVCLETKLLTSNTLVKLTISGEYDLEVGRVFLPALKSLSLLTSQMDHFNYTRLVQGCPVLEDLHIRDGDFSHRPARCGAQVESASVKRLVVFTTPPSYLTDAHRRVLLEAPSLVYLDYSSYVAVNYKVVVGLDLLVEARLSVSLWESANDFDDDDDDEDDGDGGGYYHHLHERRPPIYGDVTGLGAGVSNVTTLHLSPDSLEAFHFCCSSMPVFSNLLNLSMESNREKGWQVLPLLLKSCPNLQTLVIKGLVHRVTNRCGDACVCIPENPRKVAEEEGSCCLCKCQVKLLEISDYGGSLQELKQMRHFLSKMECLETVKVGVDADTDSKLVRANVKSLPRHSSKCNIQFI